MCKRILVVSLVVLAVASTASAGNWFALLFGSATRGGSGVSYAVTDQVVPIAQDGEGQDTEGFIAQGGGTIGCDGESGVVQGAIAGGSQTQNDDEQSQDLGYAGGQTVSKDGGTAVAAGVQVAHIEQEQEQTTEDPCPLCPPDGETTEQSQSFTVFQFGAVGGTGDSDANVTQVAVVVLSQTQEVSE